MNFGPEIAHIDSLTCSGTGATLLIRPADAQLHAVSVREAEPVMTAYCRKTNEKCHSDCRGAIIIVQTVHHPVQHAKA